MAVDFVGYCSKVSYSPGEPFEVHVASKDPESGCWVDIYRIVGCINSQDEPDLVFVGRVGPVGVFVYPSDVGPIRLGPGDADTSGCGWPAATAMEAIPDNWESGVYLAQFTAGPAPSEKASPSLGQDALFIVRPRAGRPNSPILLQVSVATWNAYHVWQNRSLYIGDVGDRTGQEATHLRATKVSFHRPGIGFESPSKMPTFPPTAYIYLLPFIQWLRESDFEVDFCAGTDIHEENVILDQYNLVLTVGHDEYWSRKQRDRVERFVKSGGNAAFFGGNLCYWQIRLVDDGRAVECFKRAPDNNEPIGFSGLPLDPTFRDPKLYPDHDNSDVTVEYHSPPLNRSPNSLTGTSMRNDEGAIEKLGVYCGAAWWWENLGGPERPAKGFTVVEPSHWAFQGSGLQDGDVFGEQQRLVGFECDGVDVRFENGKPIPTFRDDAPVGIRILAYADCRDWAEVDYSFDPPKRTPGCMLNKAALGGVPTVIYWEQEGGGAVFTAPVTDWPRALINLTDRSAKAMGQTRTAPASEHVRTITTNVLRNLSTRRGQRASA